jgi:formyl-CoA transferase
MIVDVDHPEFGTLKVPGILPKLSNTPSRIDWLGPTLGEHNREVLKDIGLTEEQIAKIAQKGII